MNIISITVYEEIIFRELDNLFHAKFKRLRHLPCEDA